MLKEILRARENRWNTRCKLAEKYNLPVVTITMNIPGPNKVKDIYDDAHSKVVEYFINALNDERFELLYQNVKTDADGPEAYFIVKGIARELKNFSIKIEERHALGRLIDIDVLDQHKRNISRKDLELPDRKCIICGAPAQTCVITRRHPLDELLLSFDKAVINYLKKEKY